MNYLALLVVLQVAFHSVAIIEVGNINLLDQAGRLRGEFGLDASLLRDTETYLSTSIASKRKSSRTMQRGSLNHDPLHTWFRHPWRQRI